MWAITCTKIMIPQTKSSCVEFTFENKRWQYFAGPIEENKDTDSHQHCGIRCLDGCVSKSAAKRAFASATDVNVDDLEEQYFKKVDTTWARYLAYAYKGSTSTVDASLKVAAQKIINKGCVPTKRLMQKELVEEYGVDFYNKRLKSNLDTFLTTDGLLDDRGTIRKEIDPSKNKEAFARSFEILQHQIGKALKRGQVFTTWKKTEGLYDNLDITIQQKFIEMLCLLPICTKRCNVQPDNLPGLYFWGQPNTGKSAFFDSGVFLKKFAQDSVGVSRFKLNSMQSGILFDDIPQDFLDRADVSGTIRQMALGGNAIVKVFGDTDSVCGYCVVTSNNRPCFFEPCPPADSKIDVNNWERNCDAWKRRFITLEFTDFVDADPINIVWSDYNLRQYAAELCYKIIQALREYNSTLYDQFLKDIGETLEKDYELTTCSSTMDYMDVDPETVPTQDSASSASSTQVSVVLKRSNIFAVQPPVQDKDKEKTPGRIGFMKRCADCFHKYKTGQSYPLWGNCVACMEIV